MFELDVSKSKINVRSREMLVSGTRNIYKCRFTFTTDWVGVKKIAVFRAGNVERSQDLDDTGICEIPWEVLQTAFLELSVGVYGTVKSDQIFSVERSSLGMIKPGSEPAEITQPPTPSVYERFLQDAAESKEIAESVRADADAGKFDGKDGTGMDVTGAEVGQIVKIAAVDENGVPTAWEPVNMPGGGDYVSYTEQELTEDQKHQARKNQGLYYSHRALIFQGEVTFADGAGDAYVGSYLSYNNCDGATFELKVEPFRRFVYTGTCESEQYGPGYYNYTINLGVFTLENGTLTIRDDFATEINGTTQTVTLTQVIYEPIPKEYLSALKIPAPSDGGGYLYSNGITFLTHEKISGYKVSLATLDTPGVVYAESATEEDTQPVRIGTTGKLFTAPSPDALPNPNALTFTGAVEASYDGSQPVSVEIPSGGGVGNFRLINSVTLAETARRITISEDSDGNSIESLGLTEVYAIADNVMTETVKGNFTLLTNGGWGTTDPYIYSAISSNLVSTGYGTTSVFHIVRIGENKVQVHTPWVPYISSSLTGFRRNADSNTNYTALKSFAMVASNSDVFSVGTTFSIYGR